MDDMLVFTLSWGHVQSRNFSNFSTLHAITAHVGLSLQSLETLGWDPVDPMVQDPVKPQVK